MDDQISRFSRPLSNIERSEDYGMLQKVIDALYAEREFASRLDALLLAESFDLPYDLIEIVSLLPPGDYVRQSMCDQLNSAIAGHAWGQVYGTVE